MTQLKTKAIQIGNQFKSNANEIYLNLRNKYNQIYGLDHITKQHETCEIVKKSLIEAADHRKEIQADLFHLQEKIRESRYLLDQTPRDSDNFITLFTSQHNLTKKEDEFRVMLQNEIDKENKLFSVYSENTRKLHELDSIRQSRQQLIAFVFTITAGIFGFFFAEYRNGFFVKEVDKLKNEIEQKANIIDLKQKLILEEIEQQKKIVLENLENLESLVSNLSSTSSQSSTSTIYSYWSYTYYPFVRLYKMIF